MKLTLDAWRDFDAAEQMLAHTKRTSRGGQTLRIERAQRIRDKARRFFECRLAGAVPCPECGYEFDAERHGIGRCVSDPMATAPVFEPSGLGPKPRQRKLRDPSAA